jgi:alpha-L-fucosidase 2
VKDVNSTSKDEKFPLPMWPFRHMSMESMSVLATAMNESLLQSYDGVLRVFPAFPADKNGRFTLHAEGGFIVSSEIKSGRIQWICIKSLLGNTCNLELPWEKAIVVSGSKKSGQKISRLKPEFKTKVNETLMILPEGGNLTNWSVISENPPANEKVKKHASGKAQLGIDRMF